MNKSQNTMLQTKTLIGIISMLAIAALIIAFKPGNKQKDKTQMTAEGGSFAIVELFTSEGCSSCPPADEFLGDIVEDARDNNQRVFALAFHVDYWNDLGWKDIYSSAKYSQRQRSYARALKSRVYTPQMIVSGKDQFVGSNSAKAQRIIERSLDQSAVASVELSNIKMVTGNQVQLNYKVSGAPSNAMLNIAVVERGIVREIKRGENNGRTLHHENVVRAFRKVDLENSGGSESLQFSDDVDINKASVIVYVQNPDTKEILGAQGSDIK